MSKASIMKKKRRLVTDTCSLCENPVWQYDTDGKAYCEPHARWQYLTVERMQHPLDSIHNRATVLLPRKDKAVASMVDTIKRLGYAEAIWVAEHLGFDWGVQWWDEKLVIRLSDMQLVAFSAAMRAHREALFPNNRDDPKKRAEVSNAQPQGAERKRKKKKKKQKL